MTIYIYGYSCALQHTNSPREKSLPFSDDPDVRFVWTSEPALDASVRSDITVLGVWGLSGMGEVGREEGGVGCWEGGGIGMMGGSRGLTEGDLGRGFLRSG